MTHGFGLLMLDTRFPRPVGDVGHPDTHPFPLLIEVVERQFVRDVLRADAEVDLAPWVAAGERLIARGALAITTSCGFLSPYQAELASRLPVPVAASSLLQVPWVESILPAGRRCGVITIDDHALGARHLAAAGARVDTPIQGVPSDGALRAMILGDGPLDESAISAELVAAGRALLDRHPEVAAIVLECTNLPPYREALRTALGRPVHDINTLLRWVWSAVASGDHR